jgi:hypothetical protein
MQAGVTNRKAGSKGGNRKGDEGHFRSMQHLYRLALMAGMGEQCHDLAVAMLNVIMELTTDNQRACITEQHVRAVPRVFDVLYNVLPNNTNWYTDYEQGRGKGKAAQVQHLSPWYADAGEDAKRLVAKAGPRTHPQPCQLTPSSHSACPMGCLQSCVQLTSALSVPLTCPRQQGLC